jgi:ABC-2 type transport system ATP-binding protein
VIRELVGEGTTLLLTTQYLDEADELADEIVVIDHGQVIAHGTSDELKDRVGGDVVEFDVVTADAVAGALGALAGVGDGEPAVDGTRVGIRVGNQASRLLLDVVRRLDSAGVEVSGVSVRRPSLDDVFLALTGHLAEEAAV